MQTPHCSLVTVTAPQVAIVTWACIGVEGTRIMCAAFGANSHCNDLWQLDEIVITIVGRKHWPWRGGDQDGYVLDEIVHNRRTT